MQINPIMAKDLKIKMRGWRAPTLISVYMLFLGLVVFLNFFGSRIFTPYDIYSFSPSIALNSYNSLAIFQLMLIIFIAPALTGGIISGERERQTLDLLLCTNLSTFSIVTGKIFVSIAHILLLVIASLPVMGTVFLYGGINIPDLLLLMGFYLATALMLGSMGMFFSSIFKKSSVSMIVSYIVVLFLLFGTIILYGIWAALYSRYGNKAPDMAQIMCFLFANPLFGFSSVIEGTNSGMGLIGNIFGIGLFGQYGGMPKGNSPYPVLLGIAVKPWMVNIAFDMVVSAVFIILGAFKIKPVKRIWFRHGHKRRLQIGQAAS